MDATVITHYLVASEANNYRCLPSLPRVGTPHEAEFRVERIVLGAFWKWIQKHFKQALEGSFTL